MTQRIKQFVWRKSGMTGVEIVVIVAIVGALGWFFAPKLVHGASRRADASTQATAKVEQAVNAQGSAVAASVVKIGEANAEAPASPSRDFIAAEVPVALSRLPSPSAQALIDAEKRRAAVMEGRAEEARKLYEQAAKLSERLQTERDEALAARRAADLALEQAAAAEHARTTQLFGMGLIAALGFGLWIYAKIYHVTPEAIGNMAAEIRAGKAPIQAMNDNLAPRQYARIEKAAKLATDLPPGPAGIKHS